MRAGKIAIAALVALLPLTAKAQSGLRQQPAGFCTSSSLSAATGLAGFSCNFINGATLQNVQYAVVCAYTQGVVWRDDGTAPTATGGSGGQALVPQSSSIPGCMPYNGNFQALQFIQQASGAVVGVTLYR